ncbi:hypothetical protein REPUB_Repub03eG0137900 [Reevesia pubescens]
MIKHNFDYVICNVYASYDAIGKREVWEEIFCLKQSWGGSWCIVGDFNTVKSSQEMNGCLHGGVGIIDFNRFIFYREFFDLPLVGKKLLGLELIKREVGWTVFLYPLNGCCAFEI